MGTTYFDTKISFSPTAMAVGKFATQAEYEAVTDWVEMDGSVSAPALGSTDNYVSQDLITQTIQSNQKTVATPGAGDLVAENRNTSTAQAQWKAAGETTRVYFIKQELNDAPDATMTNTIEYCTGFIGRQRFTPADGPGTFNNIIQPLQMNDHSIVVRPTAI